MRTRSGLSKRGQQHQPIVAVGADQRHGVQIPDHSVLGDRQVLRHGAEYGTQGYTQPSRQGT